MISVVLKQALITALCTASMTAATTSVPDTGIPFNDFFIGVGVVPAPTVTEKQSGPSGSTGYEWEGNNKSGTQISLTSLNGRGYRWGGFVWGGEFTVGLYDIKPESYTASTSFKNGSDENLSYRTVGGNVIAGYEYGIMKQDGLRAFIEILPHIGGGIARAESEVYNGTTYTKDSGFGLYGEYGLRIAGFLTERNWIYGISAGYVRGSSKIKFDIGADSTEMWLKRAGASMFFLAGYRF